MINDHSKAPDLVRDSYDEITRRMLRPPVHIPADPEFGELEQFLPDRSFACQMQSAIDAGEIDRVFVTAKSAIPVADSVRGYYEELGEPTPPISVVNSNKMVATFSPIDEAMPLIIAETERLSNILSIQGGQSGPRVIVIDQYIESGNTRDLARRILRAAGASSVCGIGGDWYGSANPEDIDPDEVDAITSVHAPFMREIGRMAAQTRHFLTE